MNNTTTYPQFNDFVQDIDKQLNTNLESIENADVVFVCGKSNTGLTTISLKVGEIQCVKKTKFNNEQTNLAIATNELNAKYLFDLCKEINVAANRSVYHMYVDTNPDINNVLTAIKEKQCVGVLDNLQKVNHNDILIEMSKLFLSDVVVTHRFRSYGSKITQNELLDNLKRTIRDYGLKVLFIATEKDKETGLINLSFSYLKS